MALHALGDEDQGGTDEDERSREEAPAVTQVALCVAGVEVVDPVLLPGHQTERPEEAETPDRARVRVPLSLPAPFGARRYSTGPSLTGGCAVPMSHVNGTDLYYEDTGAGLPILFVHGMCGNANVWDGQVARLSDTFRCVTYDRRGHTRSPLGDVAQRTVELHADDAAALIGALSLAPCILVGSSGGARIGVDLVRRYSHLFRAAVLSEPPIFGLDPENGGPGILRDLQPKIQASVAAGGLPAAVDAFFDYMCPGLWSRLDEAGKEPYRANCAELLPDLQMPPYQIGPADLRRITTMTTMVAGTTSLPTLQRVARVIADGLPNGRLVTLASSGRMPHNPSTDLAADYQQEIDISCFTRSAR